MRQAFQDSVTLVHWIKNPGRFGPCVAGRLLRTLNIAELDVMDTYYLRNLMDTLLVITSQLVFQLARAQQEYTSATGEQPRPNSPRNAHHGGYVMALSSSPANDLTIQQTTAASG
ncbi:hypothetical protein VTI28DRAFT_1382 [Corynascus sepedonium]